MRILVATVRQPFVHGGAEVLANQLIPALVAAGHQAELIAIPFNPAPEYVADQMLACRLLNLTRIGQMEVDRVIGLKFPAYLIPHPHKTIWLLHQHRAAYDLWDHSMGGLREAPGGHLVRDLIHRADRQLKEEAHAIFTISKNVTRRLSNFLEIESTPLYHPPAHAEEFHCATEVEDYYFFPSRLQTLKRQELVLRALARTRHPVHVRFAGLPDNRAYGEELARRTRKLGLESRVQWCGSLSEGEKRDAYARALAVLFPPLDEDYGYVTLEAMLASKAVISCTDSGGPLEFIVPDKTGLVASPDAESLAVAMDKLWEDRALARQLGHDARRRYDKLELSWAKVVKALLA